MPTKEQQRVIRPCGPGSGHGPLQDCMVRGGRWPAISSPLARELVVHQAAHAGYWANALRAPIYSADNHGPASAMAVGPGGPGVAIISRRPQNAGSHRPETWRPTPLSCIATGVEAWCLGKRLPSRCRGSKTTGIFKAKASRQQRP